jgi:hypothetical protein
MYRARPFTILERCGFMSNYVAIRFVLSFNLSITVPSEKVARGVSTRQGHPTEKDRRKEEDQPCGHPVIKTLARKEASAHLRANIPIGALVRKLLSADIAVAL